MDDFSDLNAPQPGYRRLRRHRRQGSTNSGYSYSYNEHPWWIAKSLAE